MACRQPEHIRILTSKSRQLMCAHQECYPKKGFKCDPQPTSLDVHAVARNKIMDHIMLMPPKNVLPLRKEPAMVIPRHPQVVPRSPWWRAGPPDASLLVVFVERLGERRSLQRRATCGGAWCWRMLPRVKGEWLMTIHDMVINGN